MPASANEWRLTSLPRITQRRLAAHQFGHDPRFKVIVLHRVRLDPAYNIPDRAGRPIHDDSHVNRLRRIVCPRHSGTRLVGEFDSFRLLPLQDPRALLQLS